MSNRNSFELREVGIQTIKKNEEKIRLRIMFQKHLCVDLLAMTQD
jgi:hypothetical protein